MSERRFLNQPNLPVKIEQRNDGSIAISGYAAVFHRASDPGTEFELWEGMVERIMPGAFDRAVSEDDVRGLFNHDPSMLLGRTSAETLRLSVDENGLRYEIDLPETSIGKDVAESIRRGDLSGSSFAFLTTDEDWRKEDGVHIREIRGVRLFDVGPVTYPAYSATTTGLRSDNDSAKESFDRWRNENMRNAQARKRKLLLKKR